MRNFRRAVLCFAVLVFINPFSFAQTNQESTSHSSQQQSPVSTSATKDSAGTAESTSATKPVSAASDAAPQVPTSAQPDKDLAESESKLRQQEFAQGSKLFQAKKYADALKHFSKAADSKADDGEARILVGYCYFNLKQYDKALKQYELAASKGKLVSVRNKAQKLAQTLDFYMRGICPGNCLKPSTPGWRKMNVPGKPERLVWMVFPYLDPAGKGGSEYWSNDHMGEVIEYVNGRPIDKGICPICHGTGKVSLPK